MSQQSIEKLRRIEAAANKKNPSAPRELVDPGVVWKVNVTALDLVGTYHGTIRSKGSLPTGCRRGRNGIGNTTGR
jgi:hypothetical protein